MFSHVFEGDAVDKPLCPLANRICGCSFWALAPFLLFRFFCCCFAVSSGETQVWLGDLRVVVVGGLFVVLFVVSFDLPAQYAPMMSLYKRLFDSLCSCKDRAFSATSAKLEEKNSRCDSALSVFASKCQGVMSCLYGCSL